jgi:hypothetical protein
MVLSYWVIRGVKKISAAQLIRTLNPRGQNSPFVASQRPPLPNTTTGQVRISIYEL